VHVNQVIDGDLALKNWQKKWEEDQLNILMLQFFWKTEG
jgi:hypothetical protein